MQSTASPSAHQPFPISPSILLLIHLHLLECPFITDPACEPQMFEPARRSLAERVRFAEEIVYFLTKHAESESVAKSIFPMYPCADSSQSTAFRLATLKYFEGAREKALSAAPRPAAKVNSSSKPKGADRPRAISITSKPLQRPTHQPSTSDTAVRRTKITIKPPLPRINSSKTRASPTAANVAAPGSRTTSSASSITLLNPPQSESQKASRPPVNGWWWRHVVTRKAILEECTGEQFERLLLALSIHALMGQSGVQGSTTAAALFDTLSTLPISYASLLSRALNHITHFGHQITLLDSRTRKVMALQKALDHSNLDTQTEDTSIAHLEAVLETRFRDLTKGRGAPWRKDSNAGEAALETLMQISGVPMRGFNQSDIVVDTMDQPHAPSKETTATATQAPAIPALNLESLPTAAANHLVHVSALTSLDERLIQIDGTQDTAKKEDAQSSTINSSTFDLETNGFESRLRALEEELEMMNQDVGRKLEEVVGIWDEYAPVDGESERYRFGGGEASQGTPEPLFEAPENGSRFLDALQKPLAPSFEGAVAAIRQEIQPQDTTAPREEETEDIIVELRNLRKELADVRTLEETPPTSPVRQAVLPTTPTTARQSRLPVPPPSPWKNAFQSTQMKLATPQTIKKLQFGPLPPSALRMPTPSYHKSKGSSDFSQKLREPTTPSLSPERLRVDSTPKTIKREQAKRRALNLPAPASRPSIAMTPLPSTNLSTMFGDVTVDQGNTDILPSFTSPWRTPIKSHRTTPRKSILWGSGTFKRTPLKSGARLSSVVPPVHQSYYLSGVATVQPNVGTPRASLDEACDEIVENLVKESWARTPPGSATPGRRLLDFKGKMRASLAGTSPFMSLVKSGKVYSPEMSEDEERSFEGDGGTPSRLIEESDEDRGSADEDEEAGSGEDPVTPRNPRRALDDQVRKSDVHATSLDASLTLRDILLKVGEAGVGGANGSFDFDLLDGSEVEVGEEEEEEAFEWP